MTLLTILIPTNTPPKFNNAFTIQCKKICESLSKKINLRLVWVMFNSIPPYEKSDCLKSNDLVIFSDEFNSFHKIFEHVKPDIVFVNGSLDFHNVETIFVSKFKKIPVITLFFRNPYVEKLSFISTFRARFRGVTAEYNIDTDEEHFGKSFTIKFFVKQFRFLFKTLNDIETTKIQSFIFFLKYLKIIFSDVNPVNKIISGDINLCNVKKNKEILIDSNFKDSSIFVVGDPYFDNHDLTKQKYIIEKKFVNPKILFITPANHEHGLCSKKEEMNLIISVINTILKNDFEIGLKIHPTSSKMKEYVDALEGKILNPISLFQSENLIDLLNDYDLVLTYAASGAIHDSVLLGKPIVNLDFNRNLTGQVVHHDDKIITHCKNLQSLISDVKNTQKKVITLEDVENFFQKYLGYSQGKPSDHAADIIYTFYQKIFNQKKY